MIRKIKDKKYFIIMCFICFIPRLILATQAVPFRTRADELGSLAGAACLAGLDWSDLLSQTAYYGVGATFVFAPLFFAFSNPLFIYKIMIAVWGVLQGLVGCIAWKLGRDYFNIDNKKMLMLLSIIASYSVVTRNTAIFNETPLILITWLLCWCLLSLQKNIFNKRKHVKVSVAFVLLLVYSLTLHTRAIMFWIAAIVIEIAYYLVKRKSLISVKVCCVFATCGYFGVRYFVSYLQNTVWGGDAGKGLANTKIAVDGISLLLSPDSWQAWVNIILGQLNTFSMISGTIIIVSIIWVMKSGIKGITKKYSITEEKICYLCIMGFCAVCMLGTIFGQSVSEWLGYAVEAMKDGIDSRAYGLKVFTYIRYAGPYIGVLIWGILILTIKKRDDIKNIKNVSIVTSLIIHAYWLVCILPYIFHNDVTNEAFLPFGLINNITGDTRLRVYLAGSITLIVFLNIFWGLFYVNKKTLLLTIYSCFLLYQFIYDGYFQDILLMKKSYNEVKSTYEVVKTLDDNDLLQSKIVSVRDVKNTSHSVAYVYQFCFFDKKVVTLSKDDNKGFEGDIIIINEENEFWDYVKEGYYGIIINNLTNEYLVTSNIQIKNYLCSIGYDVLEN